jgi:hypothetical protein
MGRGTVKGTIPLISSTIPVIKPIISCVSIGTAGKAYLHEVRLQNNHFITSHSTGWNINTPVTPGPIVVSHNLLNTVASASAAGYTVANHFEPPAQNALTVGRGTNLAQIVHNDLRSIVRPTGGAFDVGGYEFSSDIAPIPPEPPPVPLFLNPTHIEAEEGSLMGLKRTGTNIYLSALDTTGGQC